LVKTLANSAVFFVGAGIVVFWEKYHYSPKESLEAADK
jgi:hypothetical protein